MVEGSRLLSPDCKSLKRACSACPCSGEASSLQAVASSQSMSWRPPSTTRTSAWCGLSDHATACCARDTVRKSPGQQKQGLGLALMPLALEDSASPVDLLNYFEVQLGIS